LPKHLLSKKADEIFCLIKQLIVFLLPVVVLKIRGGLIVVKKCIKIKSPKFRRKKSMHTGQRS
jgi:hypothetical protein